MHSMLSLVRALCVAQVPRVVYAAVRHRFRSAGTVPLFLLLELLTAYFLLLTSYFLPLTSYLLPLTSYFLLPTH